MFCCLDVMPSFSGCSLLFYRAQTVISSCMGCTNIWDVSLFWEFACVEMSLFYLSHLIESYIWNNFPSVFNGVALLLSFSVLIKKFDAIFIFSPLYEICFFLAVCGILLYPQLWNFMMVCLGIELLLSFVVGRTGESFWSGSQYPLILEHFMELFLLIPPFSLWKQSSSHFQKCAFALICPWPTPIRGRCGAGPSVNCTLSLLSERGRGGLCSGGGCSEGLAASSVDVSGALVPSTPALPSPLHAWACWVFWSSVKILLLCFLQLLTCSSAFSGLSNVPVYVCSRNICAFLMHCEIWEHI